MFGGERRAHPPRCPQSSEQTLRCRPHNHREVVARQAGILLPWRRKSSGARQNALLTVAKAHRRMSPCRGFVSSIMSASLSEISTR